MNIQEIEKDINKKAGQKELLIKQIENQKNKISILSDSKLEIEQSRLIILEVAESTQKQLEYKISSIVTLALNSIFDDHFELVINFTQKNNRTSCDICVQDNKGNVIDPMTSSGGGLLDVVSFALRLSLWSLKPKRSARTIILDEPFRFLSRDLQKKASELLKTLSEKLELQFIIISHEETLIGEADKLFEINQKRKKSFIA